MYASNRLFDQYLIDLYDLLHLFIANEFCPLGEKPVWSSMMRLDGQTSEPLTNFRGPMFCVSFGANPLRQTSLTLRQRIQETTRFRAPQRFRFFVPGLCLFRIWRHALDEELVEHERVICSSHGDCGGGITTC